MVPKLGLEPRTPGLLSRCSRKPSLRLGLVKIRTGIPFPRRTRLPAGCMWIGNTLFCPASCPTELLGRNWWSAEVLLLGADKRQRWPLAVVLGLKPREHAERISQPKMVPRMGVEPTAHNFRDCRSSGELTRYLKLAPHTGLEPVTDDFRDRRSAIWANGA